MSVVYQTVPISDVKHNPSEIMHKVKRQPVVLTQRGESTAIIASLDTWNDRERELARLRRAVRVHEALREGDFVTGEEVDATFAAMGIR